MMTIAESCAWKPGIPGWSADILPFFDFIADRIPRDGTYVEIGAFLGRSLAFMGERRPDLHLLVIDPFGDGASQGYNGPLEHARYIEKNGGNLFDAFGRTLDRESPEVMNRTVIFRGTVAQFDEAIGEVDFVFIDGAHDVESVVADIEWAERHVSRGIIAGHDYLDNQPDPTLVGVNHALSRLGKRFAVSGTCWWYEKGKTK